MGRLLIGLADRANGFGFVRGSLVKKVQLALKSAGHDVGTADGIYGNDSARAMSAWQIANGQPKTGEVEIEAYETLTGEAPEDFEICLQLTARFEGHGFELAKGPFDKALITWGIIGFTYLHGEIQELIRLIDGDQPDAVQQSFGDLTGGFRAGLALDPRTKEAREWVDSISVPVSNGALKPVWKAAFADLGGRAVAQKHQMARARDRYWSRAKSDAKKLELKGLRGLALCFDIAVQNGGVSKSERKTIEAKIDQVGGTVTARQRREIIGNVVAEASNEEWIEDVRSRKLAIATGSGAVHGANFKMRDWGLQNGEPAAPVVQMLDERGRFDAFFAALNLQFFTPDEFRFLGSNHANPAMKGKGFGLNQIPGEDLWPNMIPTALILEQLRADLGASIRITNAFRSPAYNKAIGGAGASQHMQFTAIDFFCNNGQGPENWGAKLKEYRARGDFRGGIGIYVKNHFVHLDTRGTNVDFRP